MHGERAREGLDRRQQPLLQPDPDEFRPGPPARRFSRQASTAQLAVVGELCGEHQFRRGLGQAVDDDGLDNALGKALSAAAQILLQTADHDRFELRRLDLLAADEALRIENFHQRGKAVRVPVMRRCRQEQAVLESRRQLADCLRDLQVDGVFAAARRGGMVRLVEDQQRAGPEVAQRVDEALAVGRIDEQPMRDQEPARRQPRIDREAALAPHRREERAIVDREAQAEPRLQLVGPLPEHRRRRRDDDKIDAAAQQQLAQDQPGLDRLAEPDIVGDQEVDPRQLQRLAQRFELGRRRDGCRPGTAPERGSDQSP